jgi:hypothetical protein
MKFLINATEDEIATLKKELEKSFPSITFSCTSDQAHIQLRKSVVGFNAVDINSKISSYLQTISLGF